jgi:CrcB protein
MSGQPERLADARGAKVAERMRGQARVRHLGALARRVVLARWDILALIAAGGSLGAVARYEIGQAMPRTSREFPWATFLINVTGSFALGVLMVFVLEVWASSRYVRPFFGVGLLGGYTTFSTYVLETRDLLVAGQKDLAGVYLFGSVAAGLMSVWLGIVTGRLTLIVIGGVRRRRIRRRRTASGRPGHAPTSRADDVSPTPTTGSSR